MNSNNRVKRASIIDQSKSETHFVARKKAIIPNACWSPHVSQSKRKIMGCNIGFETLAARTVNNDNRKYFDNLLLSL